MSKLPGWLGQLGAELTRMGERLEERRVEADDEDDKAAREGSSATARTEPGALPPIMCRRRPRTPPRSPRAPIR